MRRNTVVATKPVDRVLTLAEIKLHLRVDDVTPGSPATITKGAGNSALKLTSILDGVFGNEYAVVILEAGLSTALTVSYSANTFTVNLATDGAGVATSTVNDVIAALLNDSTIKSKISATSNTGDGTGLLAAATVTSFAGGVDGISPHDDYINALSLAVEGQTETLLRGSLMPQTLELRMDCFPSCRMIELDFGPISEVNSITYFDTNGDTQVLSDTLYSVDINSTPPVIVLEPSESWPSVESNRRSAVVIEYEAGYADADAVPEQIKLGMKLFIGHLFTNRESIQVGPGITALEIPQAASWLLWPFRDYRF